VDAAARRNKLMAEEQAQKNLQYEQDEQENKRRDNKRARRQRLRFERELKLLSSQHSQRVSEGIRTC